MKKIMVIPGGIWQIKLLKALHKKGIETLNTSPYPNSPGFAYADYVELADALDKEKNLSIAEKYDICAVLSDQSDIAIPTVAYIADKLGLPGIGTEKARLFSNKVLMREFLQAHDLVCPKFKVCRTVDEAKGFLEDVGCMIIKPIDSQSSRGVSLIQNESELVEKFEIARSFSNSDKVVLAEEYISGAEFTIDGIKFSDRHYTTAISHKEEFYKGNANVSKVQYFSHYHPDYDYDLLREQHNRLVELMGLKFGLTHAEYRYHNGKFYLIEIGARGGGSNLSGTIVPYMSGIDHYDILIRMAMGEKILAEEMNLPSYDSQKHAVLEFLDFGEGKIRKIEGEDAVKEIPGVVEFKLEVKEGDILTTPEFGRVRPGYVIATAHSKDEIERLRAVIKETLKVEKQADK